MKLSRQAEVKEKKLLAMYAPEAFLDQMADTLQASLLRSGQLRSELFGGQAMVIRGATTRTKSDVDRAMLIETALDIQTLAEAVSSYVSIYAKQESYDAVDYIVLGAFIEWLKSLDNQGDKDE